MAVAFDAAGPGAGGTATCTWVHTAGAGGGTVLVFVDVDSVTAWGSISFTSVTYAGNTMTFLGSVASGSDTQGGGGTFAYGITGQASGANTVIANCAISPTVRTLGNSVSFTGATAFGAVTTIQSTAQVTSGSMGVTTSTTTGAVGMAVCDGAGGEAFTGGTINYRFGENPSSGSNAAGNTIGGTFISTGGLHTVTWTQTNGYYGAIAAEVLVASAGTSATAGLPAATAVPPATGPSATVTLVMP